MVQPIMLVVGTRAEAIKLVPVYQEFKRQNVPVTLCATFQHSDLLQQVWDIFDITPDFNLNIMKHGQDLFYITTTILDKIRQIYEQAQPSLVLVHGDTSTTFAAALAAFYLHIPIGHIEAGLRTGNMQSPFPEEMNRKVVGQIADYHFAPTPFATAHLLSEGVPRQRIFCTGNTIVDALYDIQKKLAAGALVVSEHIKTYVERCKQQGKKLILLTAHRRESFNGGLVRIFNGVKKFVSEHDDVVVFYPYHPNPNVISAIAESGINHEPRVFMHEPLLYKDLIFILESCDWVATDSGGIQEEAVSLGKRVLVLRDITERWEGVWEGSEILVGTDQEKFFRYMEQLYAMDDVSVKRSLVYGDGSAARTIVTIVKTMLQKSPYMNDVYHLTPLQHRQSLVHMVEEGEK